MITITIRTENAAFADEYYNAEIVRILRNLADKAERNNTLNYRILDTNGNTVGAVTLTGRDRKLS